MKFMVYAEDLEKIEKARVIQNENPINEDLKRQLQTKIVTNVFKDEEFKEQFLLVFKKMSEILANTLGPYGSSTMIDQVKNFSVTKDGFHVLSNLRFADERHNRIRSILFSVSHQMVMKVGDGSTSAVVAAYNFLNSMLNFIHENKRVRPKELNERIQTIVSELCKYIEKNATSVNESNYLDIVYNIANIATNENKTYTNMITEIYKEIGQMVNINIAKSETFEDKIEYEDGIYSNNAYLLDPIYCNKEATCVKSNCDVLMLDHTMDKDFWSFLQAAFNEVTAKRGRTLIVMAPFYEDFLLDAIRRESEEMRNLFRDAPDVPFRTIYLKSNLTGELNKNLYMDLSTLLGATIYRPQDTTEWNKKMKEYVQELQKLRVAKEEKKEVIKPEDIPPIPEELVKSLESHIGYCDEVVLGMKSSSFKGFPNKNEAMFNICMADAKRQLEENERRVLETDSVDNKVFDARTRYTKISCKSATIKVGGANRLEMDLNYDAVDDAVKACASALKFGYNEGCNLAIIKAIKDYRHDYEMDKVTYSILKGLEEAFINVYRTVLSNGIPDSEEVDTIIKESLDNNVCYDMVSHKFDTEGKVINSCRTDIEILKGSIAMTGLLLICNQYISSTLNH